MANTTKLTFKQYATLITFMCDEELERLREFQDALEDPETDLSDDKPWTVHPEPIPSLEHLQRILAVCPVSTKTLMKHAKDRQEGVGDEDKQDDAYNSLRMAWMEVG